ncbi:MAG: hypothetical protein OSA47_02615 [Novosphingopyxis baekryungensis]|jgi:hypothetical protein|nr:hypothetical protein [Novosphingopyxis baekryungensis]
MRDRFIGTDQLQLNIAMTAARADGAAVNVRKRIVSRPKVIIRPSIKQVRQR